MVFVEAQPDRSAASKREFAMKKLTRQQKWELVEACSADRKETKRTKV
jgi:predicted GIY-YIG superfamily endonuclease